jgi:Concanavalin A-like lectin/glucanases superfamily
MRNAISFTISLFLCPVLLFAQLPAGSIARYPLDNSATDVSGNGFNGTLTATTNDADRFAAANTATAFVSGTGSGSFPVALVTALSNDFTIGYWFKTTQIAPTAAQWYSGISLVDAEVCGVTNDYGTALIDGGKVAMGIGNPDITIKSTSATYNDGAWHFVTATRSQAGGVIILYIDGAQVATSSGTSTLALTAPAFIGMGTNPCNGSGVFTGSLDDAIAYNRVLTPVEVTNLFNFYNSVPLPLHWVSFTGQVQDVQVYLTWETDNSGNNDHFEIERSTTGSDFSALAVVPDNDATLSAAGSAWHDFTDLHPAKGNNFYRIREVDKDGKYSLSPILQVSLRNTLSGIYLQTNPVGGEAILMNNDQLLIRRMQVMDISGRVLIDQAPRSSNTQLNIVTQSLRPGYYLLKIGLAGNTVTIGFVKI